MKKFVTLFFSMIIVFASYPQEIISNESNNANVRLSEGYARILERDYSDAISELHEAKTLFCDIGDTQSCIRTDLYILHCYRCLFDVDKFQSQVSFMQSFYADSLLRLHYHRIVLEQLVLLNDQELYQDVLALSDTLLQMVVNDSTLLGFYNKEVLNIKVQSLLKLGDYQKARLNLKTSIEDFNPESQYDSLIKSIHYINLSKLYTENLLYDSSIYALSLASSFCNNVNRNNLKTQVDILIMTGLIKNRLRQPNEALYYLTNAKNNLISESDKISSQLAIILHNKANSFLLMNQLDSALHYFTEAARLANRYAYNSLKGHYRAIAEVYQKMNSLDSADFYLKKSLSLYEQDSLMDTHEIETMILYAEFLLNGYDRDKGIDILNGIEQYIDEDQSSIYIKQKLYLLNASFWEQENQNQNALEYYIKGIKLSGSNKLAKHGIDLPTPENISLFHNYAGLLGKLYDETRDSSFIIEAMQITNELLNQIYYSQNASNNFRGKIFIAEQYDQTIGQQVIQWIHINEISNGLYEHMISKLLGFKKFMITQGLEVEHEAKQSGDIPANMLNYERELKTQLSYFYLEQFRSEADLFQYQTRSNYASLAIRFDSLIYILENEHPEYFKAKYILPSFSIQDIHNKLKDDQVLLDFSEINDTLIVLQSTDKSENKINLIRIDDHFIESINAVQAFMDKSVLRHCPETVFHDYVKAAQHLFDVLVENNIDEIKNKHFIIIPPSGNFNIPFDILIPTQHINPKDYKGVEYFMKYADISYEYSALSFLQGNDPFPDDLSVLSINTGGSSQDLSDGLSMDKFESEFLLSILPGASYSLSDVSLDSIEFLSDKYNVLHIATHGIVVNEDPLLSSLYDTKYQKGSKLYSLEILNHHLDYDLLVLSGCNTGNGTFIAGEGKFSHAKAFYVAGCKNQLVTLNQIEDRVSEQIVTTFFFYLSEGFSTSQSLRKARIDYLNEASLSSSHPYYWSSFRIIGDVTPEMSNNRSLITQLLLLILSLALGAYILYRRAS